MKDAACPLSTKGGGCAWRRCGGSSRERFASSSASTANMSARRSGAGSESILWVPKIPAPSLRRLLKFIKLFGNALQLTGTSLVSRTMCALSKCISTQIPTITCLAKVGGIFSVLHRIAMPQIKLYAIFITQIKRHGRPAAAQ